MNLFEKIQAVAMDIKNIEKNMTVGSGSYAYKAVSDYDVTLAVKESEFKHGLVSFVEDLEVISSELVTITKKDGSSGEMFSDLVKVRVKIVDIAKPEDFVLVSGLGRGFDSGDKGPGKGITYARKYALLGAYKIVTGEDPDADHSDDVREKAASKPPQQQQADNRPWIADTHISAIVKRLNEKPGTGQQLYDAANTAYRMSKLNRDTLKQKLGLS